VNQEEVSSWRVLKKAKTLINKGNSGQAAEPATKGEGNSTPKSLPHKPPKKHGVGTNQKRGEKRMFSSWERSKNKRGGPINCGDPLRPDQKKLLREREGEGENYFTVRRLLGQCTTEKKKEFGISYDSVYGREVHQKASDAPS